MFRRFLKVDTMIDAADINTFYIHGSLRYTIFMLRIKIYML